MMHCIFLEGYQTGILPRRAPGVRLGGERRICVSNSWVSRLKPKRRKYAWSAIPSSGLAMVLSFPLKKWAFFSKNSTAASTKPMMFLHSGTCGVKLIFRLRQTRLQRAALPMKHRCSVARAYGKSGKFLHFPYALIKQHRPIARSRFVSLYARKRFRKEEAAYLTVS
jgi:hypothetical protein